MFNRKSKEPSPSFPSPNYPTFMTCELIDQGDAFLLCLDIPGVGKVLDVELLRTGNKNTLVVSGERVAPKSLSETEFKSERFYGKFRREFDLPEEVVDGAVKACQDFGVLSICLPKAKRLKTNKIDISLGDFETTV